MSGLPLQPDLRPPSRLWSRLLLTLTLLALIVTFGFLQSGRPPPPHLLLSGADAATPEDSYPATVQRLINRAEERVWVMMYVMRLDDEPVAGLGRALVAARKRGLDVRVVLDQSYRWGTDEVEPKHLDAEAWLRDHDVPILIDDLAVRTHAKVVLVDADIAVVGSHNWTRSALARNHETSILHVDPVLVEELERIFRMIPGW